MNQNFLKNNMKLKDILKDVEFTFKGVEEVEVKGLSKDSREVQSGDIYFAVRGDDVDGHDFIEQALDRGAVAVVLEDLPKYISKNISYIQVSSVRAVTGPIASNFYGNPTKKLKIVGVTGTNGKTTTATLLHRLFEGLGHKAGLITAIDIMVHDKKFKGTLTTPDTLVLQKYFSQMVESGCTHAFLEVSSHGIHQDRIAGIDFTGAVFTNITEEHLNYHKTFENYLETKKKFFDQLHSHAFALANKDDENGEFMLQSTEASKQFYALGADADFKVEIVSNTMSGLELKFGKDQVKVKLCGEFNAYNILAVYSAAILLQEKKEDILKVLPKLDGAEGRFDYNEVNGKKFIVDYAHTPDALENALQTLRNALPLDGKIITVFGCGGGKYTKNRSVMTKVIYDISDFSMFTSDNPRGEGVSKIWEDMRKGLPEDATDKEYMLEPDRRKAIRKALEMSGENDVVIMMGKGHEDYQEIEGVIYPFVDKLVATEEANLI
jgi:UDP-N-acetylmuramoyl-L-alanyl-D-glutamate--2,6-diaminopimelate ligase